MNANPKSSTKVVQHLAPVALSATNTPSAGVDVEGFNFLQLITAVGVVGASATIDVKLQHSSASDGTGDAFADITGATLTQIAVGNTGTVRLLELNLSSKIKKYVRVVSTYGGSGTAVVGHVIVLSGPRRSALCTNTYDAQLYLSGSN